jgi:hypothetical protein
MLDAEKVPVGDILDGRLWERMHANGWCTPPRRAVPAPGYEIKTVEWYCAREEDARSCHEQGMAWYSLLSYLGNDNDAHSGKEPRSAHVDEWMSTLTGQPMFDALEPSRPQALALVCTQEAAFPMVCGFLSLLNTIS